MQVPFTYSFGLRLHRTSILGEDYRFFFFFPPFFCLLFVVFAFVLFLKSWTNTNFAPPPPSQRYNWNIRDRDKENRVHVSSGFQILVECLKGTSILFDKVFYCPSRTESQAVKHQRLNPNISFCHVIWDAEQKSSVMMEQSRTEGRRSKPVSSYSKTEK